MTLRLRDEVTEDRPGPGAPTADPSRLPMFAAVRAAIDQAAAGRGRVILVHVPGGGSALLDAATEHARSRVRVVRARCEPTGRPLAAWTRVLANLTRRRESEAHISSSHGRGGRFTHFRLLAAALEAAARRAPLVVLLDDLDNADRAALLFLEYLAPAIAGLGLAVIGVHGDIGPSHPLRETAAELAREPAATVARLGSSRRPQPIDPEAPGGAVFRREGDYWTIVFDGRLVRLRDAMGLHYLAPLLRRAGERVHVRELLVLAGRDTPAADRPAGEPDRDAIERARLAVTKGIKTALQRIVEGHPGLGHHLVATVRCGYRCGYLPDPRHPIRWQA